jgi:hypothetical protein
MIARQTAYGLPSVLPPFNGGLHCGFPNAADHEETGRVLPPSDGGLHCGYDGEPY